VKCLNSGSVRWQLLRSFIGGLLVATVWLVPRATLADPPDTSSNRFLFIIDVSAGMKQLQEPAREALFDLIYSGARGQMTNGDTFGVWLAGASNDTSGSVETWKHKYAVELASRAALRVKDHGFQGKSSLATALADVTRVIRSVGDVSVVIVTSGETPLAGTPFDAEINARIKEILPDMTAAKATVNIVLAAQDAQFVAWSINSPDFLIQFPNLPPRPKRAVAASTPRPAPASEGIQANSATATRPAPPPRVASKPIIITRETVDHEKQVMHSMASTLNNDAGWTNIAGVAASLSNAFASTTSTNTAPAATNAVVEVERRAGTSPSIAPPPAENPSEAAGQNVALGLPRASVTNNNSALTTPAPAIVKSNSAVALVEPSSPDSTGPVAEATAAKAHWRLGHGWVWAFAGAVFALLLVLLVRQIARRRPSEASLISRAIALERAQRQANVAAAAASLTSVQQ